MSAGPATNTRAMTKDPPVVTVHMLQDLMNELQAIEQESLDDDHDSKVTQGSDLEEDSEGNMTEMEEQSLPKIKTSQGSIQEGYDPTEYYVDVETTHFCLDCQRKNNINHTEEGILGSEQGTMLPTRMGTTVCNALIDTGATRCCMSETYYKKLQLPKIQLLQNVSVRSATGSNLAPIGLVNCTFLLGDTPFEYNCIVCRNLTRPLILGKDFLIQNHIAVRYSDNGKCISDHQQQELIAEMNIEVKPHLRLTNSVSIPGRTLAVVQVNNTLTQEQSGHLYEIEPNHLLTNEHPNLYIIPTIHKIDLYKSENVPLVVINFSLDNIYLSKGEIMGFMQC